MASLIGDSLNIRTIVRAYPFDAKTDVAHHHKEASDKNGYNDESSAVTLTPIWASKYKVATTTPKMNIMFNQSEDIKVGYFVKS